MLKDESAVVMRRTFSESKIIDAIPAYSEDTARREPGARSLRILVVSQVYPPDMGGASTRAYNVVKGLIRLGHRVTVVAALPHYPGGDIPRDLRGKVRLVERTEGATVIRTWVPSVVSRGLWRRLLLYLTFCVSALTALPLVRNVDVIWAANPNVFALFPSMFLGKLTRTPVVANVDDLWPEELFDLGMINSPLLRKLAEKVAEFAYTAPVALTPISLAYVEILQLKYPSLRDDGRCRVIPAGVDVEEFVPHVGWAEQSTLADGFTVLYIGAFSPAYDFDQVLAAAKLLDAYPDIHIILQGGGELGAQLESRCKQLSLSNLRVIQRIVTRKEVANALREADALLLPLTGKKSIELGISSKLYEYQASGKPIICCSAGESASYVSESESGIVIPPGDPEALAWAILRLRSDRKMAASLGEAGRRWVESHYSFETLGRLMETVFIDILGQTAS